MLSLSLSDWGTGMKKLQRAVADCSAAYIRDEVKFVCLSTTAQVLLTKVSDEAY